MFDRFATAISDATGSAGMFVLALVLITVWGVSGPVFGFSDTWQLVVNTGTTVVTFLMIFLLQHSQNEDTREVKAMLDALVERFDLEREKDEKLGDEG